jgi:AraC family transcriptional regulator
MDAQPVTLADPGRFEIYCHLRLPALYSKEARKAVRVCVPFQGARYQVTLNSNDGRAIVKDLGARDVLVIPADHSYAITWQRPAWLICLQLSESFIAQSLGAQEPQLTAPFTIRDAFISAAAAQIRIVLNSGGALTAAFGEAIATAIAFRIGVGGLAGSPLLRGSVQPLPAHQLALIENYINAHLDQPIALAELADLAGVSTWHFIRRFRASYGLSPRDFIIERRLARAKQLLSTSGMSITKVALEVGMSHIHFTRTFVRRFGLSPREFRQQKKAEPAEPR